MSAPPLNYVLPSTLVAEGAVSLIVCGGGRVVNKVAIIASGINADGRHAVLDVQAGTSETAVGLTHPLPTWLLGV